MEKYNTDWIDRLHLILHGASAFQILNASVKCSLYDLIVKESEINKIYIESNLSHNAIDLLIFGNCSLGFIKKIDKKIALSPDFLTLFESDFYPVLKKMVLFQSEVTYEGQYYFYDSLVKGKNIGKTVFDDLQTTVYSSFEGNSNLKKIFYEYMDEYSNYCMNVFLQSYSTNGMSKILDIGGGSGINSFKILERNQNAHSTIYDLGFLIDKFKANTPENLTSRVCFIAKDILEDEFDSQFDTILFIHQLVIWSKPQIRKLVKKALSVTIENGRIVIFSSFANDNKCGPVMSALDSVYFKSVATGGGEIYSVRDYLNTFDGLNFSSYEVIDCQGWTPHKILILNK